MTIECVKFVTSFKSIYMIQNMKLSILVFLASLMFMSCGSPLETADDVKSIDALLTEVSKAKLEFDNLPHLEITERLEEIKKTIAYVEEASGGEINRENGLLLDNYRSTKSIVKRFGSRTSQMRVEFDRTKSQLENFKEALQDKATHDKNNTAITEEYISQNMIKEKEAASTLINSVEELKNRSIRFIEKNQEKSDALAPYLNSLK